MTVNQLMQHYEQMPTNTILSAGSGVLAFIANGIDPVYTAVILPVLFFAAGKAVDVGLRIWLEKRKTNNDQ